MPHGIPKPADVIQSALGQQWSRLGKRRRTLARWHRPHHTHASVAELHLPSLVISVIKYPRLQAWVLEERLMWARSTSG